MGTQIDPATAVQIETLQIDQLLQIYEDREAAMVRRMPRLGAVLVVITYLPDVLRLVGVLS